MNSRWLYALLFVMLFVVSCTSAQEADYRAPYASVAPLLDGHIDFIWSKASWSEDWRDIVTSEEVLHPTRFKCLWDDEFIYFIFAILDPDIRATGLIDHEPLFKFDNVLEVFLDPNADQQDYYELQVNAKRTRWELTLDKPYKDGGKATSPNTLAGLEYAILIDGTMDDNTDTDERWTIEMKVPWSSLMGIDVVPPTTPFKANFSRVYQDDDDISTNPQYWLWKPIGAPNIHITDKWGRLVFEKP